MRDMGGWLPGGLVFAVAFAATRRYGLLVPAGILTGLGTGILLEDAGAVGEPILLGLGLGSLATIIAGGWLRLRGRAST